MATVPSQNASAVTPCVALLGWLARVEHVHCRDHTFDAGGAIPREYQRVKNSSVWPFDS